MVTALIYEEHTAFLQEYEQINLALVKILQDLSATDIQNQKNCLEEFYIKINDLIGISEFTSFGKLTEVSYLLRQIVRCWADSGQPLSPEDIAILQKSCSFLTELSARLKTHGDLVGCDNMVLSELRQMVNLDPEKTQDIFVMDEDERKVFLKELSDYIELFVVSCDELVESPPSAGVLFDLYKAMHTVKGFASIISFAALIQVSSELEKIFLDLKAGNIAYSPEIKDVVSTSRELLLGMLDDVLENKVSPYDIAEFLAQIKKIYGDHLDEQAINFEEESEMFVRVPLELATDVIQSELAMMQKLGNFFDVVIVFEKGTEMKSVRCFQIMEALKQQGRIMVSIPTEDDVYLNNVEIGIKFIYYSDSYNQDAIATLISAIVELQSMSVKIREV